MVGMRMLSNVTAGAVIVIVGALGASPQAEAFCVSQPASCTGGGYTVAPTTSYSFTDISTSGTRILAGAQTGAQNLNIGFDFNFFGSSYNNLWASTNGTLAFGSPNVDDLNVNLETSTIRRNNAPTIAALWDAWTFRDRPGTTTDGIYYQTSGTQGSRQFTVQWNQAASKFATSPSGTVTFQAVLFEGSNDIVFSYLDSVLAPGNPNNNAGGATIGIRNTDGNVNQQRLEWSYNTPFSAYQSIRFSRTGS